MTPYRAPAPTDRGHHWQTAFPGGIPLRLAPQMVHSAASEIVEVPNHCAGHVLVNAQFATRIAARCVM